MWNLWTRQKDGEDCKTGGFSKPQKEAYIFRPEIGQSK